MTASVIVDARLEIENLADHFGIEVPEGEFESVGGLLIHLLGKVPQVNDTVVTQNLEFTVIAADERRVKLIRCPGADGATVRNFRLTQIQLFLFFLPR